LCKQKPTTYSCNFSAYCGTIIENENPQVAPWLFKVNLRPLLREISLLLMPCFMIFVAGGLIDLLGELPVIDLLDPKQAEIPPSQAYRSAFYRHAESGLIGAIGSGFLLGALGCIVAIAIVIVAYAAGILALKFAHIISKNISLPVHVFVVDDWRPSTIFPTKSVGWYGFLNFVVG
jgi:hypothetical protein